MGPFCPPHQVPEYAPAHSTPPPILIHVFLLSFSFLYSSYQIWIYHVIYFSYFSPTAAEI